jgi:polyhydroxybutyrate depolymerase
MTLALRTLFVLAICVLLALASGALAPLRLNAAPAPSATSRAGTLPFGGIARTYRLYRPAGLARTAPVPLVVVLHGGFGNGEQAERTYHWDEAADAHGFVALYPDGILRAWNAGTCCGQPMQRQIDDVGFLTALVEQIERDENIDPRRLYFTGISNGAMMSYRLACESTLAIAAIGPVAGTLVSPCAQAKPTSVLAIHGLADRNVPFVGGVGIGFDRNARISVPATLARWREIDRCEPATVRAAEPVQYETSYCAGDRTVELITVAGAGHQWPGSETPPPAAVALLHLDQPSHAVDATAVLWDFFASHRL